MKSGVGGDGSPGVGPAHSRGVGGATPAEPGSGALEGAGGQLQTDRETASVHRGAAGLETKLAVLSEMARRDPRCRFSNLAHLLSVENLSECFYLLKSGASAGVDGRSWVEYHRNLAENLRSLVERMKAMRYRPQPVRRVYIPKDSKSLRPLGIPTVEDKLVQMGMARILSSIYEEDFLGVSFGFRPGRSCHDALAALDEAVMSRPVNWVLDADIKGFFDSVDHRKLVKCLRHRIADERFLRLIVRFLKSGVMEDGEYLETDSGTPQGGVVSPVLANIFLHYALDRWFEGTLRKKLRGYARLIRYADDFVICFQYREDAEHTLSALHSRMKECGLTLSEEKTRLLEFGRKADAAARRGGPRPPTFDFLGLTHFCSKTRRGYFKLGRRTSKKKFRQKVAQMRDWLRRVAPVLPMREWWGTLCRKVQGHYNYYGVSGNSESLNRFLYVVERLCFQRLNRRSQRRSFTWERFSRYLKVHPLPRPRITHNLYSYSTQ